MASKVTMPAQARLDAVTALFASAGGQATFRLFMNQVWIDDALVLGTLTEANYEGYAPMTITLAPSLQGGPSGVVGQTARMGPYALQFPICDGGEGNQVYGVFMTYVASDANTYLFLASNCFDDEVGIDVDPPVGILLNPVNPPPVIVFTGFLWDFFQPTPDSD